MNQLKFVLHVGSERQNALFLEAPILSSKAMDGQIQVIQQVHLEINLMSPENIKIVRETIEEKAKTIQLEPTYIHEKRNPHAHIYSTIKQYMGQKYLLCDDEDVEEILTIIRVL
jgi:hypothetical protein